MDITLAHSSSHCSSYEAKTLASFLAPLAADSPEPSITASAGAVSLLLVVFDMEAGFLGDDDGSEIVVEEDDKAAARFEE